MTDALRSLVQKVGGAIDGSRAQNLSRNEAQAGFDLLLAGDGSEVQLSALLVAWRAKGTTCDELSGCAAAARARLRFPELPGETVVVATSRLGKFHTPTLGVAIAAAAAAAGVPILVQAAPHARGAGVTLGDVWQRMIGPIDGDAARASRELGARGLACWSPTAADAGWERLLRIEDEIGLRSLPDTVVKLLVNPESRVLVPSRPGPVLGLASDALASLGHQTGIILQGLEGSIEPALAEQTRGVLLEDGIKSLLRVRPSDFGLGAAHEPPLGLPDRLEAAVAATLEALTGGAGPAFQATLLGAALLVRAQGRTRDLASAMARVREAIESGAAHRKLQESGSG